MAKKTERQAKDVLHYILLVGAIFGGYWLGDMVGFTDWAMSSGYLGLLAFFGWFLVIVIIADKVIHKGLKI